MKNKSLSKLDKDHITQRLLSNPLLLPFNKSISKTKTNIMLNSIHLEASVQYTLNAIDKLTEVCKLLPDGIQSHCQQLRLITAQVINNGITPHQTTSKAQVSSTTLPKPWLRHQIK